jgi:hypothetical protein
VRQYERLSPLRAARRALGTLEHVGRGDCLVAFSRREVHAMRHLVEMQGKHKCCVVRGLQSALCCTVEHPPLAGCCGMRAVSSYKAQHCMPACIFAASPIIGLMSWQTAFTLCMMRVLVMARLRCFEGCSPKPAATAGPATSYSSALLLLQVYGALPPEARSQQAVLFNQPRTGYNVLSASDAVRGP